MTREQIETLIVDNITTNYNGEITAVKVKNILDAIVSDYRHLSDPIALSEVTNLVSSLAGKQATLTETNLKTIVDSLVEMTTITTADKVMATHNAGTTAKWFSIATLRAFFKTYFDEIYQAGLISGTNIKTINGSSILGSGNLTVGASSGVWGISDASGVYTYYSTWALAMASATSGQTVELFADISETTNAYILKDGVNVNGNGHTITFTNSDHAVTDNNVAVNCKLFNLTIVRSNASGVGYRCLYIDNTSSKVFGCGSLILKNSNSTGLGLYLDGECSGIIIECANSVYGTSSSSNLYNFIVKSFGTGYGVYMTSGGYVNNGIIESTSTGNDSLTGNVNGSNISVLSNGYQAVSLSAGVLINSKILSLTSVGATISGSGKLKNCYVESRGSYAVRSNGLSEDCIDCIFKSTVSYAVSPNNGEYHKCTFVAEANTVTGNWNNKDYFFNCTFISKWNNSGAHCIANFVSGTKAIGCSFIMTNSSAYPVYNSVAINIYSADCKINGTTNFLHSNVTNIQTNTHDSQGNIIIN